MISYIDVSWDKNASRISIGPRSDFGQLYLPECPITVKVFYEDKKAIFKFRYRNERLVLSSATVEELADGLDVKDFTELKIPSIKSRIMYEINTEIVSRIENPHRRSKMSDEEIAQLYWISHVSDNAGRKTVANITGWSRSNTNYHLNKLDKKNLLPRVRGYGS